MDSARKGEIALELAKHFLCISGAVHNKNELENIAKEIRVPIEELKQFSEPFIQDIQTEYFQKTIR